MSREIDIGSEFSDYLVNRNKLQGDGSFTAIEFREKFLQELENEHWWNSNNTITLNFKNVVTLGPSWANEVFAFYTDKYAKDLIKKKIIFKDLSVVKREIIDQEIDSGYVRKL